jgi:DHA1 family tetracycline resistance protein-like MFS transporter
MKNRQLLTIFLIVFIDLLGFGLILPLLPYIGEKFGANPLQIGLLTATYSFFQLIASPVLGRLSDRYGRKKLLIISQVGSFLGYLILGIAGGLPLIFLSRIIDGATGGNISIAQAYISDITDRKNRAKAMGLVGAAFGLGFIFGPAIGGLLSRWGFAVPAYFAAFISLITVTATAVFLKETVDIGKAQKSARTSFSADELRSVLCCSPVRLYIFVFFILNFAFSVMQGNFALWAEHTFGFGPSQNGILFTYIGIISVLVQLKLLPFFLGKYGEKKIFIYSPFILGLGLASLAVSFHPYLLFIPLSLMPVGNGLFNPVIQSLASEKVPPEDYGGTLGLLSSAGSLGRIVGPIAGGFMYVTFSKDIPFLVAAIMVFGIYIYLKKYYR